MGRLIIKPERERDLYVEWSTIVKQVVAWGTREHMHSIDVSPWRMDRADQRGSSAVGWSFGYWDDEGFIYDQRGWLPRKNLATLVDRLTSREDISDLLEPFDDEED